jgi:KaiC/GvpD/RAD55 family RecA-like ATPase/DNA-binding response OmpR family regulator
MQFLIEGLDRGERCALLTQENPNDLLDQARFLGYDFQAASERDQLAVIQYRLDFAHNYSRTANPETLARELIDTIGSTPPARLVIDTILPFADVGSGAHHAANALLHVMEHLSPTALFTVPGDVSDPYYTRLYDSVLSGAGGIFHLTTVQSGIRELALRKVRQGPAEWAPLRMLLRPGIGLVTASDSGKTAARASMPPSHAENTAAAHQAGSHEAVAAHIAPMEPERGEGVVVIDATGKLPADLGSALQSRYNARVLRAAPGDLVADLPADAGAIVIMLDAQEPEMTLAQVRQLRQDGAEHAILLIVTGEGFRSATRARAIRAGADDVLEYDHAPGEVLDRVEIARQRGHRAIDGVRADVMLLQPTDDNGTPLPVDERELARAVKRHIEGSEHPFFALALVRPAQGAHAQAWRALATELRLADGDLLAECADGRLALYLHDISRLRALDLKSRIRSNHSTVRLAEETIYAYPLDSKLIENWIHHSSRAPVERATA